jgi:hypothetical protein
MKNLLIFILSISFIGFVTYNENQQKKEIASLQNIFLKEVSILKDQIEVQSKKGIENDKMIEKTVKAIRYNNKVIKEVEKQSLKK